MKVRFWGVRGSIPTPGPDTVKYGGNTACYEVITHSGRRLIFDAGTGIRRLGNDLAREMPVDVDIFVSHTHWDHIQGFPFFVPAFVAGNRLRMYGPALYEHSLEGVMRIQMDYAFFPVREAELKADITYQSLTEETIDLGDVTVVTKYTNHPVLTLAFRITEGEQTIIYTGDSEPYYNVLRYESGQGRASAEDIAEMDDEVTRQNARHLDFCSGADILIHDAQYSLAEYAAMRRGWGHSPMEEVIQIGLKAGVKHLVMTSHDPSSDDATLTELEALFQAQVKAHGMKLSFAREGTIVDLDHPDGP